MNGDGLLGKARHLDPGRDQAVEDLMPLEEERTVEPLPPDSGMNPCIGWTQINSRSIIPLVLFDRELRIRWRNERYREFRESDLLHFDYRTETFDSLFPTFTGSGVEAKIRRTGLLSALGNPETRFSWQGNIEGLDADLRKFRARLTITPEIHGDDGQPLLFRATFDDITVEHDHLVHSSFEGVLRASLIKDEDTTNHVHRVNTYSRVIAEKLRELAENGDEHWSEINIDFVHDIGILAAFHDVGKIGTPESILLKPGKLNETEWLVMKEHPTSGAFILSSHPNPMARDIAHYHHERWNGSGYPYGLAGTDIPLSARIVALADVYDALRTRRPYKEPYSEEKTASMIHDDAGVHFDPGIVEAFLALRKDFARIFAELGD